MLELIPYYVVQYIGHIKNITGLLWDDVFTDSKTSARRYVYTEDGDTVTVYAFFTGEKIVYADAD